jgi:hypothetical protein
MKETFGLILAVWITASVALPASAKQPTIVIERDSVTARVTPGSNTAWFYFAQEPTHRGTGLIYEAFLLRDDDGDGNVTFRLKQPLLDRSVWTVAELGTGEYAIAAPPGMPLRRTSLPPSALVSRGNAKSARLLSEQVVSLVFVVRPGKGAWVARIRDGSRDDGDLRVDNRITAMLDAMKPVGDSPAAPDDLEHGDIVVFADPLQLTISDTWVVK